MAQIGEVSDLHQICLEGFVLPGLRQSVSNDRFGVFRSLWGSSSDFRVYIPFVGKITNKGQCHTVCGTIVRYFRQSPQMFIIIPKCHECVECEVCPIFLNCHCMYTLSAIRNNIHNTWNCPDHSDRSIQCPFLLICPYQGNCLRLPCLLPLGGHEAYGVNCPICNKSA